MEEIKNVDLDKLVQKMCVVCPNLPQNDEFLKQLRSKLEDQIINKIPKVEISQLDLNYIILNVKNSLSEFQKRIDESLAQQQLRRTTRVRKNIFQDPSVVNSQHAKYSRSKIRSSSPSITNKTETEINCSTTKCCHQSESDLCGLIQVESLPISASTNLVTIFVPSILQEKLHSVKYKISIDLNRLDLTKKILDLNVSQLESDLKNETLKAAVETNKSESQNCELTYEIKDHNDVQFVEQQNQNSDSNIARVEVKTPDREPECEVPKEPAVCIVKETEDEILTKTKQRGQKRKDSKPSNGPPKKRGRKPGSKNKVKSEKSELAKYVEMFECNGNSPSSALSQIVTSTTQNWEILPEQTAQITYFMNGEWTPINAPSNNVTHSMVTTTNGNLEDASENENFIPFDDFVNFIDNPSLDVGNNVIARVLDGTADTQEITVNSQDITVNSQLTNAMSLGEENIEPLTSNTNTQTMQAEVSVKRTAENKVQSISRQANIVDSFPKQLKPSVLCSTKIQESNVIFSTSRSMPSLDIEEGDFFCSTPQKSNISENVVAFSIKPQAAPAPDHNSSFNQNEDTIMIDSAIEIDKRETLQSTNNMSDMVNISKNTQLSSNIKDKGEVIKKMSLLEIEKDFDDSLLDFGDYLDDDLLSLAPSSCFNSPIDDRFADSNFVNIEESEIKSCNDVSNSVSVSTQKINLETSVDYKDEINTNLKNLKMPRANIVHEKAMTDNSPQKHSIGNLHPSSNNVEKPCISDFSIYEISKLFGSLCYKFLADMCFETSCKFSHQFLDICIISTSLSLLQNDVLNIAYKFIWRHNKLFKFYFPIFCDEYGRRNVRQKLASMIRDCELQPKCISFLKNIYSTLTGCGFSKVNACRFILCRVQDRSHLAIDVLLEIIIESDAQIFATAIEQFSTIKGYKFAMNYINELATICLQSSSAELIPALIKCLINVDQTEFVTLRSPDLIKLLEMIKNGRGI